MIKWVVFDLSGVVFTEGFAPACKKISAEFFISESEVREFLLGEPAKNYRLGLQDPAEFWKSFEKRFNLTGTQTGKARKLFFDSYELIEEAVEFVSKVRKKTKAAFFTFSPPDRAKYHSEKYGFEKYFDKGCYTSDIGAKKTDPNAYKKLCELLGAKPSEVVFTDDKEEYADAARIAGLNAIVFRSFAQLGKDLEEYGIMIGN